jgi:hypothetical protein
MGFDQKFTQLLRRGDTAAAQNLRKPQIPSSQDKQRSHCLVYPSLSEPLQDNDLRRLSQDKFRAN